jgi:hypothetical protein
MALTVYLQDEGGHVVDDVFDPRNTITHLIEPLRDTEALLLLKYVDPCADTLFNHLQARDLLIDIATLASDANGETLKVIEKLRDLIQRCIDHPRLYLKFYGD